MKKKFVKLICSNPTKECSMVLWRETNQPTCPIYCPSCLAIENKNVRMVEEYEKNDNFPKIYYVEIKTTKIKTKIKK